MFSISIFFGVSMLLMSFNNYAADKNLNVYTLGKIDLIDFGIENYKDQGGTSISREEFESLNQTNIAQSVAMLPGVVMTSSGARNERTILIRGFDLRQVPFSIDGIPVYVPYDGYVDLGRFITNDISEIQISKGFTSSLVGPNALGGILNIVTEKPTKPFQITARTGLNLDNDFIHNGSNLNLSIGGKQEKSYYLVSAQTMKHNHTRLSNDYPKNKVLSNSRTTDNKINIKLGYTPSQKEEYSLNYIDQHGEKEVPTYSGSLSSVQKRYWKYPTWDKRSLYWISQNNLDNSTYLKTRAFYDVLKNTLDSYSNQTFQTITGTSFYDDNSYGGMFEFGYKLEKMTLKSAFHLKRDNHREYNQGDPARKFIDDTYSVGIEDTINLNTLIDLTMGFSYDWRDGKRADDYNSTTRLITSLPSNKNTSFNPMIGIVYRPTELATFHVSLAKKTRFPTMKDRYSYRRGTALPNPNLSPENSVAYEIGTQFITGISTTFGANLFYYDLTNTIQSLDVTTTKTQMQNIGKSKTEGGELEFHHDITPAWNIFGNYTYLSKKNKTAHAFYFTNTPNHHLSLSSPILVGKDIQIIPNFEYSSKRYSDTSGSQITDSFFLAHLVAEYRLRNEINLDIGIKNLFDKNYELVSGYPEEGRNYFVNIRATF